LFSPLRDIDVALISGISHTLFDKVEVYNQGKMLKGYDNFARLYWLNSLISKPKNYFSGVGSCNGDILDDTVPEGEEVYGVNMGAMARQTMAARSGKIHVFNRLWIPCFQTDKLIPTKMENLQIHFYLNDEKFGN
jgi:hypothetical protein